MILPIYKERIPYEFEVNIKGEIFTFELHYNGDNDFFAIDLSKNGEVIIYGEKITYGRPLFGALSDTRLPTLSITPLDPSGDANEVTYDNFGESVLLYVGDVDG